MWGGERCGGLQKENRSSNPIRTSRRKSLFFRRDVRIGSLDRNVGIETALFRLRKNARFRSEANSYAVGSVDRKGRFPSGDQIGHSCVVENCLFDPNFFDRGIRYAHPVEKPDLFEGMRRSDCSTELCLTPTASLTTHKTHDHTHYTSSDAGLTVTIVLLLLLLTTTRRGTSCSPPASSVYRHPIWQQSVLSMTFLVTPLLLLCSRWRLSTKSNVTASTMKRMRTSRAPNERFARRKGLTKTCA